MDGPQNNTFLLGILDDLLEEYNITLESTQFLDLLKSVSIPLRHELGCLSKILGHPFVDLEKGTRKLLRM